MDNLAHPNAALPQSDADCDTISAKSATAMSRARRLARRVIVRALIECDGEIDDAAKKTGLTPSTFAEQMRQYQLPRPIMYRPGFGKMSARNDAIIG
ncbi:MAG: hypothetical protein ABL909_00945 [Sphingopyxis sp.]